MKNILIIKLGHSETLEDIAGKTVNLGDVLRTTFILHFFKNCHVSWLVDEKAIPLLQENPYISQILSFCPENINKLKKSKFDIIINFEKSKDIIAVSKSLNAAKLYGFNESFLNSQLMCLPDNDSLFQMSKDVRNRKKNKYCWQRILSDAIDKKWKFEDYILGYKPKTTNQFDIGFNWTTGKRWSNKAWPLLHWKELEKRIMPKYSVSWQQGYDNLYEYMDWINSCHLILTADTLGLHLGLALKKRVVALFGPTSPHEFYFYNHGTYLLPKVSYKCIPCFQTFCSQKKPCMQFILPEDVQKVLEHEFKKYIFT